MTIEETTSYLIIKYGSVRTAHELWINYKCKSYDEDTILNEYFTYFFRRNSNDDERKEVEKRLTNEK